MATVKTIKGVDDNAWTEFRALASKNRMNSGKFFEELIDNYKKNSEKTWKELLNAGKVLSDKEADEMMELVRKLRSERGFRY
jgi:hypothetical protein